MSKNKLKRKVFNKAVSLTLTAAIGCTPSLSSGFALNVSAAVSPENISETEEVSSDLVNVIVKVSGEAILATSEGIEQGDDFLETEQAVQIAESLEDTQSYVQEQIRELYSELEVKYSYSVLYNGFSCEIPENLIEQIKALPYVEDVTKAVQKIAPEMATAPSLGGYPAYYDFTGCSGEGQVIAVIDTELDVTHPMFAPLDDSVQVKLTEEDVAEIASTIGFNVDVDPAQAYRSNKLPFVVDYADNDPINAVGLSEDYPATYHGTHVSGIVAGNQFTDEDGKTISGIAKDAQLVFMAISDGIYDDEVIAALEDAVKLHADVINMSFGSSGECFANNPYEEVYQNAINAGITLCKAAGNYGDGSINGEIHTAANPDRGIIDTSVESGSGMLVVASASNVYTQHNKCFVIGENKIPYAETYRTQISNAKRWLADELSGEYEYVYCGFGMSEDFAQKDLTGKIALVNCGGGLYIQDKAEFAKNAGAVGIIAIGYEGESLYGHAVENDLPSGFVSYEDGQNMIEAENKTLVFSDETVDIDVPTSVVFDSSYGVHQNLELRPDIMGIGDHVESANYNGTTAVLGGTSMASPYVAGCMAVLNEYLQKKGTELENTEKLRYMRNLVMTSAVPCEEDGMFVTPRRQGAGMISLNNVIADKVLLTGDEGESKIQLYDNIGDEFSFNLNLNNISDQDVDFTSARLVLTTDDSTFNEELQTDVIKGQQSLNSSADLNSLLHIGAGENRTETIYVSLDSAQTSAIKEIFTNGFFVDGYLLLEGAENCCDISVPLVGFCGDWSQVPIFSDNFVVTTTMGEDIRPVRDNISLAKATALISEICKEIPQEEYTPDTNIFNYATEEQLNAFIALGTDTDYYLSPNGDGLADTIGMITTTNRFHHYNGLNIYNDKGELVATGENTDINKRLDSFNAESFGKLNLEEGIYTAQITGYVNYQPSVENPQKKEFQFTVDNTAPELSSELTEKDGRKILTVTAKDSSLDGIYITGFKGSDKAELYTLDLIGNALETMRMSGNFIKRPFSATELPFVGKFLTGTLQDSDFNNIDFADMLVADPDENGVFTFEYDVTDFSSYTISAMDKAYNISSVESESAPVEQIAVGVYMTDTHLYSFTEDTIKRISFKDGSAEEKNYTFGNGELVCGDTVYKVYQADENSIRLVSDKTSKKLTYCGEGTSEKYPFYTTDQIEKRYQDIMVSEEYGWDTARTEIAVSNGIVALNGYVTGYRGEVWFGDYKVNIFTGEIVDAASENMPDLFPLTFEDFARNAVLMMIDEGKIYYLDFNAGKIILQENGTEAPISYTINNTDLQFNTSADSEPIVFSDYSFMNRGNVAVLTEKAKDGKEPATTTLLYFCTPDTFSFYTNDELSEMAVNYYKAQYGEYSGTPEFIVDETTGFINIQMTEKEVYAVDAQTACGFNQAGEEIDLTSTLPPMNNPFKKGVWFSFSQNSEYYVFNDDKSGKVYSLSDGVAYPFTYEMNANGAVLSIQTENGNISSVVRVYPQEDGTVKLVSKDYSFEILTYLNDKSVDDFSFYTTEQLINMAEAHSPIEPENVNANENQEGTVSLSLINADGSVIDVYTVDPQTAEGTDNAGNPVDIKKAFVPQIPDNAYSLKKLEKMALKDYESKTGVKPASAEAVYNRDGSAKISIFGADNTSLNEYTVDPVTGKGTDIDGEEVNLPQTGINTVSNMLTAVAGFFMFGLGIVTVRFSGIGRRRKENE